jgi:hypothetical protein
MAIDPNIARGIESPINNYLGGLQAGQQVVQQRNQNALAQRRVALDERQTNALIAKQDAASAKEAEMQEIQTLYPLVKAGDPQAVQAALQKAAAKNPAWAQAFQTDPQKAQQALVQGMEQALGVEQVSPDIAARLAGEKEMAGIDQQNRLALEQEKARYDAQNDARENQYRLGQISATGEQSRLTNAEKPAANPATLSKGDLNKARTKLNSVSLARKQLAVAKEKFKEIEGSLSAGPGGNFVPTPKGMAFDAAIDAMRSSISSLTRVPGIGAMSDYETRLDQAKMPARGKYESVTAEQLNNLQILLDEVEKGYAGMIAPTGAAPSSGSGSGKAVKWSDLE